MPPLFPALAAMAADAARRRARYECGEYRRMAFRRARAALSLDCMGSRIALREARELVEAGAAAVCPARRVETMRRIIAMTARDVRARCVAWR